MLHSLIVSASQARGYDESSTQSVDPMIPYPHLSHEDEARLTESAREGDAQARETLVLSLVPKVRAFAFHHKDEYHSANRRLEIDDLVQEAVLCMWDKLGMALWKDNPCAYLLVVGYNTVRRYCHLHATAITTPDDPLTYYCPLPVDSLHAPLRIHENDCTLLDLVPAPSQDSTVETLKDYTPLYQAVAQLSYGQRAVIEQHYGLFDSPAKTLQDVKQDRGVSEAMVYKQHQGGLGKLQSRLAPVYPSFYDESYRPGKQVRPEERTIPPEILARLERVYQKNTHQGQVMNAFQLRSAARVEYRYASAYIRQFQLSKDKQPSSLHHNQALEARHATS